MALCPSLHAEVAKELEKSQARRAPAITPCKYLDARHEVTSAGQTPSSGSEVNAKGNFEQYTTASRGSHKGVVTEEATKQEAEDSPGAEHPSKAAGLVSGAEDPRGATQNSGA